MDNAKTFYLSYFIDRYWAYFLEYKIEQDDAAEVIEILYNNHLNYPAGIEF